MSEPLTKDKINKECDETCTEDTEVIHLKDLKNALEYLESELEERYRDPELYQILKKAFPAIYEKEGKG